MSDGKFDNLLAEVETILQIIQKGVPYEQEFSNKADKLEFRLGVIEATTIGAIQHSSYVSVKKPTIEEALEIMKKIYAEAKGKDSKADYQIGYLAGYETALAHLQNIIDGKTTIPS